MKKIDFTAWFLSVVLLGLLSLSHVSDSWAGGITSPGAARGRNADITSLQNLHGSSAITTFTLIGSKAGDGLSAGLDNTLVGDSVLSLSSSANDVVAVGHSALQNYTNSVGRNVCVGSYCQTLGAGGSSNTFIGFQAAAFSSSLSGSGNVGLGDTVLYKLTSGGSNSVMGINSAQNITSGSSNTILGANSAQSLQSGSNNVCIGYSSCQGISGSNNLRIDVFGLANPLVSGTFDPAYGTNGTFNIYGKLSEQARHVLTQSDPTVGLTPVAITVAASPFAYTATFGGSVAISAGTVTAVTLTRASVVVWSTTLSTDIIPVRAGDIVTVTYTAAPTMYQLSN